MKNKSLRITSDVTVTSVYQKPQACQAQNAHSERLFWKVSSRYGTFTVFGTRSDGIDLPLDSMTLEYQKYDSFGIRRICW